MAKPKSPRKSTQGKESSLPSQITAPPVSDVRAGSTQADPAIVSAAVVENTQAPRPEAKTESSIKIDPNTDAKKPDTRKTMGRPEIVKGESRANLVPINLEDEIRRLAYIFSESRGFVSGHENEDWLNAEREILQRYRQQSA